MSNSRSFRRSLKASSHVRPSGDGQPGRYSKGHVPWNKGLALTTRPCLGTVRRWLEANVAEGTAERRVRPPDGTPGRPLVQYRITGKGLADTGPPPEVWRMQMRQLRRWENAKQRSRKQRYARKLARLEEEKGRIGRRLTVLQDELAKLDLAAEMAMHATEALLAAGKDAHAVLHPEEVDVLVEYKCATRKGDDALVLNPAWLEEYNRALDEERADAEA